MSKRAKIPDAIVTDILTASRPRCCVCLALHGDNRVKAGQIAHLDRNPSNSAPENLVWLCFEHHDQYDSTTSQSKGLTIQEVRRYRSDLFEHIASGGIGSQEEAQRAQNVVAGVFASPGAFQISGQNAVTIQGPDAIRIHVGDVHGADHTDARRRYLNRFSGVSYQVDGEVRYLAWSGPFDDLKMEAPRMVMPAELALIYKALCEYEAEPWQPSWEVHPASKETYREVYETDEQRSWKRKLRGPEPSSPNAFLRVRERCEPCLPYCGLCGRTYGGGSNYCAPCGERRKQAVPLKIRP